MENFENNSKKKAAASPRFTNKLVGETSPYLLQHAHNPVDWYPWGEEALNRAKDENKPILLSIGYSACHWCHVMEHESFENEAIAALMNENFINIKVDREERPDLDSIYMEAVQALTGRGGWPMTVFLNPQGEPFYAGTYFPPDNRHPGIPSFPQVLLGLSQAYREKPIDVAENAGQIREILQQSNARLSISEQSLKQSQLDAAYTTLQAQFDRRHGGIGGAPKFPQPMALEFMLRSVERTGDQQGRQVLELTLYKMALGGMYDQLGGGFHRYSTDAVWLVPHFEKMLYDNSQLTLLYLHAFQAYRDEFYKLVATETLEYVKREMLSPEGGFYSTQDADSEGEEGKFFVWSKAEIEQILGPQDSKVFNLYYGIKANGNFEGANILSVVKSWADVISVTGLSEEQASHILERSKEKLLQVRESRVHPATDDKIITAWNGLMLKAFAVASRVLGNSEYREIAVQNAEFLLTKLRREDGRLFRTYKAGHSAKLNGYLEDYSYLIDGLLALYEATFELRWLEESLDLARIMVDKFWDKESGNFYDTPIDHEQLVARPRSLFDNATPSGNSVAADVLVRLSLLTGDPQNEFRVKAEMLLRSVSNTAVQLPSGFGRLLSVLDLYLSSPKEIVIAGERDEAETEALLEKIYSLYLPNSLVMLKDSALSETEAARWPLLQGREKIEGRATAFVCENYTCQRPVNSPQELEKQLN